MRLNHIEIKKPPRDSRISGGRCAAGSLTPQGDIRIRQPTFTSAGSIGRASVSAEETPECQALAAAAAAATQRAYDAAVMFADYQLQVLQGIKVMDLSYWQELKDNVEKTANEAASAVAAYMRQCF